MKSSQREVPPSELTFVTHSDHLVVLDIGCYTGLSALAWYEGTRKSGAHVSGSSRPQSSELNIQIFTIEYDAKLAAGARETFSKHGCDDRIEVMEGKAEDM